MRLTVHKSFEKDIEKITDKKLAIAVMSVIENLEHTTDLGAIRNLKKIKAKGNYYRIRVGDYRIGFHFTSPDSVALLRLMHRKDIYTYFP
jgi:mRNA interferase RelE/StbE